MEETLAQLEAVPAQLWSLFTDPTSNLVGALTLYGIIGVLLLILLVIAIMFLMDDTDEEDAVQYSAEDDVIREPAPEPAAPVAVEPKRRAKPLNPWVSAGLILLVGALVLVVTGYSTAAEAVCVSCHVNSIHAQAPEGSDPHEQVDCVSCHEPGGFVGRYAGDVAHRLMHYVDGSFENVAVSDDYGRVTQGACMNCHETRIARVLKNPKRGLVMSHAEPLLASVKCLECHRPEAGVVAGHNAGMNPCLRCHDARIASSECDTCHDRAASAAARSAITTAFAKVQVPEVRCGGCHDEKRECDTCHGTRMPHTKTFMVYAHARAGAVDFWFNEGKGCAKCHTATRRPCQKCHGALLGKGHSRDEWRGHQFTKDVNQCNTCHQQWAYAPGRDFCLDVCHTPDAIKESPR